MHITQEIFIINHQYMKKGNVHLRFASTLQVCI